MRITSVSQFRELAAKGLCGNTPQIFPSLPDFLDSLSPLCFATSTTWDQFRVYHCTREMVRNMLREAKKTKGFVTNPRNGMGVNISTVFGMEAPSIDKQMAFPYFQGELWLAERKLYWAVNEHPLGHVKRANLGTWAEGVEVYRLLKAYLKEDYEMMWELEEKYPGSVIEFSGFGFQFGIYGKDTTIWEVRHY